MAYLFYLQLSQTIRPSVSCLSCHCKRLRLFSYINQCVHGGKTSMLIVIVCFNNCMAVSWRCKRDSNPKKNIHIPIVEWFFLELRVLDPGKLLTKINRTMTILKMTQMTHYNVPFLWVGLDSALLSCCHSQQISCHSQSSNLMSVIVSQQICQL